MVAPKEKHKDCRCLRCEKHVQKMLDEHGWIVDLIRDGDKPNFHSHYLESYLGHKDIQLVYPLPDNLVGGIMHTVVGNIKKGRKYKAGDITSSVLEGLDVLFVEATETGRTVLRIILPDKEGRLKPGEIISPYDMQWDENVKIPEAYQKID